jgi:hypothetical protein
LFISIARKDGIHPVNAIVIREMLLVTEFILDIQSQDNATRDPKSEPRDINDREYFVFEEVAKRNLEVVLQHNRVSLLPGDSNISASKKTMKLHCE